MDVQSVQGLRVLIREIKGMKKVKEGIKKILYELRKKKHKKMRKEWIKEELSLLKTKSIIYLTYSCWLKVYTKSLAVMLVLNFSTLSSTLAT